MRRERIIVVTTTKKIDHIIFGLLRKLNVVKEFRTNLQFFIKHDLLTRAQDEEKKLSQYLDQFALHS